MRTLFAIWINSDPSRKLLAEQLAQANAVAMLGLEKEMGIKLEIHLFKIIHYDCKEWVLGFLTVVYLSHTVALATFVGYGFT